MTAESTNSKGQDQTALSVSKISKLYRIWKDPAARLKAPFLARVAACLPRGTALHRAVFDKSEGYFRDFYALKNVSFEVEKGDCVGILGRNGAGKSTLLEILAGTLPPSDGEILINGRVAALLELGSGFNTDFTGRENVYVNGTVLGLSRAEIDRKFADIAAFADIGDFIEQPVKTYSSGMMMRLAFAVAIHVDPDILIVDEALSVGDAKFQKKCFDRIRHLQAQGTTILFVSHDPGTIVQICNKAFILNDGQVYAWGEPHHIAKVYHQLLFDHEPPAQLSTSVPAKETHTGRELRYGDGKMEIYEVGLRNREGQSTGTVDVSESCQLYFRAAFREDIDYPLGFGYIISTVKGIEIFGTKAGLHGTQIDPGKKGQQVECVADLCMRLVPGDYFVSVAMAPLETGEPREPVYHDYRFDCLHFSVVGPSKCFTTSLVDLNAALRVQPLSSDGG